MELAPGVFALPGRLLWLEGSRALVAADAHLGYEDVIGGALPLWSTSEIAATLCRTAAELGAREIVLLGDALHNVGAFDVQFIAAVGAGFGAELAANNERGFLR